MARSRSNLHENEKLKAIENSVYYIFKKSLNKKQIQLVAKYSKLKKIRKTLKIQKNDLQTKNFKFLNSYYLIVNQNICYTMIESNYRKIVVEIFFPSYVVDMKIFDILPEITLVFPRNTVLLLIPFSFPDNPEITQFFIEYKNLCENQRKRNYLIEVANWKSLDSINRLLYFLYQYWIKGNHYDEFITLPSKKIISYITGNSHEVVIRNFKKLQKMNYIVIQKEKIKINQQRLEQWVKNSKIVI